MPVHSSRFGAFKKSESACKERDSNIPIAKGYKHLETHFRIRVVSKVFTHMSQSDRISLVYTELLRLAGRNPIHHVANDTIPTTVADVNFRPQFKLTSTYGKNVFKLPIFRFIDTDNPLTLIIEALTPSQWKPEMYPAPLSERCGDAHAHLASTQLEDK